MAIDIVEAITDAAYEEWLEEQSNQPVTMDERETLIWTNDKEKTWRIQTKSRSLQNHLISLGLECHVLNVEGTPAEMLFIMPKNYLKIGKPRKGNPDIAEYSEKGVKARQGKDKS